MPSRSGAQHRFMEMVAHSPAAAKRTGVPQSVGKDFAEADKGRDLARLPDKVNHKGRAQKRYAGKQHKAFHGAKIPEGQ